MVKKTAKKTSRYEGLTHAERIEATEHARREARYSHAKRRIQQIVDGAPPFTNEQRSKLALLLSGTTPGEAADE